MKVVYFGNPRWLPEVQEVGTAKESGYDPFSSIKTVSIEHLKKYVDEDEVGAAQQTVRLTEVKAAKNFFVLKDCKGQLFTYGHGVTFRKRSTPD